MSWYGFRTESVGGGGGRDDDGIQGDADTSVAVELEPGDPVYGVK